MEECPRGRRRIANSDRDARIDALFDDDEFFVETVSSKKAAGPVASNDPLDPGIGRIFATTGDCDVKKTIPSRPESDQLFACIPTTSVENLSLPLEAAVSFEKDDEFFVETVSSKKAAGPVASNTLDPGIGRIFATKEDCDVKQTIPSRPESDQLFACIPTTSVENLSLPLEAAVSYEKDDKCFVETVSSKKAAGPIASNDPFDPGIGGIFATKGDCDVKKTIPSRPESDQLFACIPTMSDENLSLPLEAAVSYEKDKRFVADAPPCMQTAGKVARDDVHAHMVAGVPPHMQASEKIASDDVHTHFAGIARPMKDDCGLEIQIVTAAVNLPAEPFHAMLDEDQCFFADPAVGRQASDEVLAHTVGFQHCDHVDGHVDLRAPAAAESAEATDAIYAVNSAQPRDALSAFAQDQCFFADPAVPMQASDEVLAHTVGFQHGGHVDLQAPAAAESVEKTDAIVDVANSAEPQDVLSAFTQEHGSGRMDGCCFKKNDDDVAFQAPPERCAEEQRRRFRRKKVRPLPDEDLATSEAELRRRAQLQLDNAASRLSNNIPTIVNYTSRFDGLPKLRLDDLTPEAQNTFVRAARREIDAWLIKERQRYAGETFQVAKQSTMCEKLRSWHQKKQQDEEQKRLQQQKTESKIIEEEKLQEMRRRRRNEMLHNKIGRWVLEKDKLEKAKAEADEKARLFEAERKRKTEERYRARQKDALMKWCQEKVNEVMHAV